MFRKKKTLKAIALSLAMSALLLPAATMEAQVINRGLLQNPYKDESANRRGALDRNRNAGATLGAEAFGAAGSEIGNEPFGAPLGGGIGVLLAAGMGYALIQSKKNKQN